MSLAKGGKIGGKTLLYPSRNGRQKMREGNGGEGFAFVGGIRPASRAEQMHRRCDELPKVTMKNGEEEHVLIHIEVQEYDDLVYAKKMYLMELSK